MFEVLPCNISSIRLDTAVIKIYNVGIRIQHSIYSVLKTVEEAHFLAKEFDRAFFTSVKK